MLGGLSQIKEADEEVNNLVKQIKVKFEELNYKTNNFTAISYKTQVVNGTNYFIKIQTDTEYVHIRVYQQLKKDEPLSLSSYKLGKNKEDEITYF